MARPPGFKRHKPYTTKDGPFCGAKRRSEVGKGKLCRLPAGHKTDHPGQGRCKFHGGRAPIKTGRYSSILHNAVKSKMLQLEKIETNVMDLVPEATLLRALLIDFINRHEDITEALLAWYADGENATKPRRILDIADAGRLIDQVTKVVERIHKMRQEGAISLETFRRVTEQMGIIVAKHVNNRRILAAIETEWSALAIDAKQIDHHTPAPDVEVEGEE